MSFRGSRSREILSQQDGQGSAPLSWDEDGAVASDFSQSRLVDGARQIRRSGSPRAALKKLGRLKRSLRDRTMYHLERGLCLKETGEYSGAIAAFTSFQLLLSKNPRHGGQFRFHEVLCERAYCMLSDGEFDGAVADVAEFCRRYRYFPSSLHSLRSVLCTCPGFSNIPELSLRSLLRECPSYFSNLIPELRESMLSSSASRGLQSRSPARCISISTASGHSFLIAKHFLAESGLVNVDSVASSGCLDLGEDDVISRLDPRVLDAVMYPERDDNILQALQPAVLFETYCFFHKMQMKRYEFLLLQEICNLSALPDVHAVFLRGLERFEAPRDGDGDLELLESVFCRALLGVYKHRLQEVRQSREVNRSLQKLVLYEAVRKAKSNKNPIEYFADGRKSQGQKKVGRVAGRSRVTQPQGRRPDFQQSSRYGVSRFGPDYSDSSRYAPPWSAAALTYSQSQTSRHSSSARRTEMTEDREPEAASFVVTIRSRKLELHSGVFDLWKSHRQLVSRGMTSEDPLFEASYLNSPTTRNGLVHSDLLMSQLRMKKSYVEPGPFNAALPRIPFDLSPNQWRVVVRFVYGDVVPVLQTHPNQSLRFSDHDAQKQNVEITYDDAVAIFVALSTCECEALEKSLLKILASVNVERVLAILRHCMVASLSSCESSMSKLLQLPVGLEDLPNANLMHRVELLASRMEEEDVLVVDSPGNSIVIPRHFGVGVFASDDTDWDEGDDGHGDKDDTSSSSQKMIPSSITVSHALHVCTQATLLSVLYGLDGALKKLSPWELFEVWVIVSTLKLRQHEYVLCVSVQQLNLALMHEVFEKAWEFGERLPESDELATLQTSLCRSIMSLYRSNRQSLSSVPRVMRFLQRKCLVVDVLEDRQFPTRVEDHFQDHFRDETTRISTSLQEVARTHFANLLSSGFENASGPVSTIRLVAETEEEGESEQEFVSAHRDVLLFRFEYFKTMFSFEQKAAQDSKRILSLSLNLEEIRLLVEYAYTLRFVSSDVSERSLWNLFCWPGTAIDREFRDFLVMKIKEVSTVESLIRGVRDSAVAIVKKRDGNEK